MEMSGVQATSNFIDHSHVDSVHVLTLTVPNHVFIGTCGMKSGQLFL